MPRLNERTKKLRAQKYIKDLEASGFSHTNLARKEGVTVQAIINRENKPFVQAALNKMAKHLDKVGVTDKFLAKRIKKGIFSKHIIPQRSDKDGNIIQDREEVDDNSNQHRYLETALKLKRHLSDAPAPTGDMHVHFSKVDINAPIGERIQDVANILSQNSGR